jgi:hypothetical protein
MNKDNGGPAFPCVVTGGGIEANCHQVGNHEYQDYGMTLRDYFAAKAVMGMAGDDQPCRIASISYAIADAMLLERAK